MSEKSPGTDVKMKKTVIKCCLLKHLNRNVTGNESYLKTLLDYIDRGTEMISKMMRRSSLIMLYHISRIKNQTCLPDLKTQNTTWWKNVLKMGLLEFGSGTFFPDEDIKRSYTILKSRDLVKDKLAIEGVEECPIHFDQVISSAATLLETITVNNLWFPLIKRLERFCKAYASNYNEKNKLKDKNRLSAFDLMNLIRSGNIPEGDELYGSSVPSEFVELTKQIRNLLNEPRKKPKDEPLVVSDKDFYLWDDTSKELNGDALLKCNIWLLKWFVDHEKKGFKLFPVCNVERKHIRLDEKTLINLINLMLKPKKEKDETKKSYADRMKIYEDTMKTLNCENYSSLQKSNPGDPSKILRSIKKPISKDFLDQEAYKIECEKNVSCKKPPSYTKFVDKEKFNEATKEYEEKIKRIKNDPKFIENEKNYKEYVRRKQTVARLLFPEKVFHMKGKSGDFQASITTDGVSVSFQYETPCPAIEKKEKEQKSKSRKKENQVDKVEDYDCDLSFVSKDTVVGGLDPGRCSLATIVIQERKSDQTIEKKTFSLSRGQYLVDSGTRKFNETKAKWFLPLQGHFTNFSKHSLKNGNPEDVIMYLDAYNQCSDQWWSLALKKRESRAKMQSYIGKRKTIDRFFAQVKKCMDKTWGKEKKKVIAYGHAGPHMKPSGKGEMSVPTSSTYKACKRIFGPTNTIIEDESYTTKICSCCKCEKLPVFINPKNQLCAYENRKQVKEEEKETIEKIIKERKDKENRRKGGKEIIEKEEKQKDEKEKKLYYPEVRGLRFCPKCRKFLNRDKESAKTIGLLHILRSTLNVRPNCFCKKTKSKGASLEDVSPMMPIGKRPHMGVLSDALESMFDS